ncbi:MAG: EAL domain-containing protein [Amphritea sp.]
MTLTIRQKIILAFVFSTIFGVILVSLFLERSLKEFAVENWSKDQQLLITSLQNNVGNDLKNARNLLEYTAQLPNFRSLKAIDQIDLAINGIPLAFENSKRTALDRLTGDNGPFSVVFMLLPNGDHYLSHPFTVQQGLQRYNLADREYFKQTAATGATVVSDSFIGADGILAVAVSVPVRNLQGEIIAYLGGVRHLDALSEMIHPTAIAPFEQAMLVDSKGALIAHSNTSQLSIEKRQQYGQHPLIQKQHSHTSEDKKNSYVVEQYQDSTGTQWLSFHTEINNGWGLFIQRRVDSVLHEFSNHIRNTTILIAIILLTVSGFGVWVSMVLSGHWKEASAKLKQAHDLLEKSVEKRTRELAKTKQQLQLALEGSGLGLWDWYVESGEAVFNERWAEIIGYRLEELQPIEITTWMQRIHPDDYSLSRSFLERHYAGELAHFECEMRLQHKSGEWVWVQCRGKVVQRSEEGQPLRMIGTLQDISEQKKTEIQLRQSARVFEHAHEGILITDDRNIITDVNRAFCQLTGYSREEAIGRNPNFLQSGKQPPELYQQLWDDLKSQGYWKGEIWNRKKNGDLYAEQLTISALKNRDGKIDQYVGIFSDITHFKENQQRLEQLAHYDALTGLPNRILLADRLEHALSHTDRMGNILAVAYLDLDNFKPINDSLGHEIGDKLLVAVASRLKHCVRADDTISRLGGDEFILLLPELDSVEKCNVAFNRIISSLAESYYIDGHKLSISASIGISLYPMDKADADTLLRHADQAMYIAKQSGRNCYHFFDPSHEQVAKAQQDALNDIKQGLKQDQFILHYQPKVDMSEKRVLGAEALIRWQHPEQQLLFPDTFLPAIENTDIATQLGQWVLNKALAQLHQWRQQGLILSISVNIAARHLEDPGFIPELEALLSRYPELPRNTLELEILETSALEDIARVSEILNQCRQLGVTIALDDFGTGYSSLTYFKRLPIDTVKIDRDFVMGMLDDEEDFTIVEGVISLAHAFNRAVIAEGVESDKHGEKLLQLGCRFGQGFGIAKAMPGEQIPHWIEEYQTAKKSLRQDDTVSYSK